MMPGTPETTAKPAKTAIIYLRVSTARQAAKNVEPEGYSIPAQRTTCIKKRDLGATVIEQYVDAGASARSADRDGLRRMLARLVDGSLPNIDLVIVHKLDRLARDRADDVAILFDIRKGGAALVSVSEQIDETPAGRLKHGIVASFTEFYSKNLSDETTWQKVQDVLASRRIAGDRSWKHGHFLKVSSLCGRCGGRVGYGWSKGKGGRTSCNLPYLPDP